MPFKFISVLIKIIFAVFVVLGLVISAGNADAIEITAASCSAVDIQSAANAVKKAGGGTVYIPPGNATHSAPIKIPDGISLIGAGQDRTIIANADIRVSTRFYGKLDKGFRISGMTLENNSRLQIDSCHDFRIDHITITTSGGTCFSISRSHSGLIDNCVLMQNGPFYGITISRPGDRYPEDWVTDIGDIAGKETAIFIEDCEFKGGTAGGMNHGVVGHGNAHYVVRNCNFHNMQGAWRVDSHGPGYGPPCGTRLIEVYNNTFDYSPNHTWIAIAVRGGSALIFDNQINNHDNGIMLTLESKAQNYAEAFRVSQTYIWDNTFTNLKKEKESAPPCDWENGTSPHGCEVMIFDVNETGSLVSKDEIKENQHYFLRKPTQASDGFSYTPYEYPHPFKNRIYGKGGSDSPHPHTALRILGTAS